MFVDGTIVTAPPRDRLSPGPLGVRTYVRHKCSPGYTLFSTAFGYTEYLIDMNGMVVHTWPVQRSQYAELLPSGNLMADIYGRDFPAPEDRGIEELAPDGEQVWSWRGPYHHDFQRVSEDEIVTLVHSRDPILPGFYVEGYEPEHMLSDVLVCVNRKGETLWEFPFRDHVEELHELAGLPLPVPYASLQPGGEVVPRAQADWAHTNTCEVLPDTPLGRRDDRFRAGNVLFSFRSLDIIGIADVEKDEIVWAWGLGTLDGQHQPTMTAEGTILLFDNGTARGYSAVIEIDPASGEELWRYEDRAGFFSAYRSGVQRLPAHADVGPANTLVTESDAGRILELTPEGEVVWDYYSPFLGQGHGAQGRHVYRATRYSEEEVSALFAARRDEVVVGVSTSNQTPLRTFPEALRFYREGLGG
jgi:hypothetical protein